MTAPRDLLDLTGTVVLVSGGSGPLARGIADRFAEAGADVTVAVDGEELDTSDAAAVDALVAALVERTGRLDVAVHCVGPDPRVDAATADADRTRAVIDRDLLAGVHLSQRANAAMQGQETGGAIVHVTTLDAQRPRPGTAVWGAAGAGLLGLAQSLAVEWAPKVRVNTVSVGPLDLAGDPGGSDPAAGDVPPVPMARLATATDVADACLFLASGLASYVTGTDLVVHGGGEWPPFLAAASAAADQAG